MKPYIASYAEEHKLKKKTTSYGNIIPEALLKQTTNLTETIEISDNDEFCIEIESSFQTATLESSDDDEFCIEIESSLQTLTLESSDDDEFALFEGTWETKSIEPSDNDEFCIEYLN